MTLFSKTKLRKAFNAAAGSYDAHASLQKATSERLSRLCAQMVDFPVQTFLDIGAGTGQTTHAFLEHFPEAQGTLLDIAPALLAQAKTKIPFARTICTDAETYNFPEPYDLIVSNLCVQWFLDFEEFLERVLRVCRLFAFSTLLEPSFGEYRRVFMAKESPTPTFPYHTQVALEYLISKQLVCATDVQVYHEPFESALAAARHFQKIGANTAYHPVSLRALFMHSGPVTLDYHVFFAILAHKDTSPLVSTNNP